MTTYDYYDRPLHRWWDRVAFRIAAWTDHYPVPFLRGTDGCTWRERQAGAKEYAAKVTLSGDDLDRARKMLAERPDLERSGPPPRG